MRIICKLEKRALDADYKQVREERPGYVLLASERRVLVTNLREGKEANCLQNADRAMNAEL
jgi:hypothetical protein